MCVGHPKTHPCQHTSVTFNHCVAAQFNPETGRATACDDTTYAAVVETNSKCPNQLCFFEELGRVWICCQCGNGPNVVGWCAHDRPRTEVNALTGGEEVRTECEHCCCGNCTAYYGGGSGGGGSKKGGGGGSSRQKKNRGSSKGAGSSSHGGGSSGQATTYQWIEEDYGSRSGSSSHKKRKN